MTMRLRMLTILFAGFALSGMSCQPVDMKRQVALACVGYTSVLESLVVRREAGLLSEGTIARVDELRSIANPICMAEDPPVEVGATLDAILIELERIAVESAGEKT